MIGKNTATRPAPRNGTTASTQQADPIKKQTEEKETQLALRVEKQVFALAPVIKQSLINQGMTAHQITTVMATCLAARIPPVMLAYANNIQPILSAANKMTRLGHLPGQDFYVSIFRSNQQQYDEFGEPLDGNKKSEPTVVVMPSIARRESNAKTAAKLEGIVFHTEPNHITDPVEAKTVFDRELGGTGEFWGKEVRVCRVDLYKYYKNDKGQLTAMGSGKPMSFYGFYLPYEDANGKKSYVETKKVMANYTPSDIAEKRAMSKAYREVTREDFPRDDTPIQQRLLVLMDTANRALTGYEQEMTEYGIDIDQAVAGDYEIIDGESEAPVIDAGTAGFDPKASGPENEKKTETSSGPEKSYAVAGTIEKDKEIVLTGASEHIADAGPDKEEATDPTMFFARAYNRVAGAAIAFCEEMSRMCGEGEETSIPKAHAVLLSGIRDVTGWDNVPVANYGVEKAVLLASLVCDLGINELPSQKASRTLMAAVVKEWEGKSNSYYGEDGNVQAREWIVQIAAAIEAELAVGQFDESELSAADLFGDE